MQVEPNYSSVGSLFRDANVFRIPEYQRGYAWEKSEVEDFIEDFFAILNNENEHFFGCLVCAQEIGLSGHERVNQLVDGQQRLTTFIILSKCLIESYESILSRSSEYSEYVEEKVQELRSRYIYYKRSVNKKTEYVKRLTLSRRDNQFFQAAMDGSPIPAERESHKRILSAFSVLRSKLFSHIDGIQVDEQLDALGNIEEVINNSCNVIQMVTSKVSDAYRLFQVINDRGKPLNQTDLLRAKTLGLADDDSNIFFDKVEAIWDSLDEHYGGSLQKLLGYYYSSITGEKVKSTSFYDDFMNNILSDGKLNPAELYNRLKEIELSLSKANLISNGEWPFDESKLSKWDFNRLSILINNLKHTHPLPLLLSASSLDESVFSKVVQTLEVFFFRYKLVCKNKIDPATGIYLEACGLIKKGRFDLQVFRGKLRELIKSDADNELFANQLANLKYSVSVRGENKLIKYFLLGVEENWRWYSSGMKKGEKGRLSQIDKSQSYDFQSMTLEHVYPRNPKVSNQDLQPYLNDIGNLTLLDPALNSSLGNMGYDEKYQYFIKDSRLLINRDFEEYPLWTLENLSNRRGRLIEAGKKIFIF